MFGGQPCWGSRSVCHHTPSTHSTDGIFAPGPASAGAAAVAIVSRKRNRSRSFLFGSHPLFVVGCGQRDVGKRDLIVTDKIVNLEINSDESLIGIPKAVEVPIDEVRFRQGQIAVEGFQLEISLLELASVFCDIFAALERQAMQPPLQLREHKTPFWPELHSGLYFLHTDID